MSLQSQDIIRRSATIPYSRTTSAGLQGRSGKTLSTLPPVLVVKPVRLLVLNGTISAIKWY